MRYGFAHRGGAPGPDNTLAAFAAALALGADGLETDAWLSLDGAVVLDHDGRVRRGGQPIAQVRRDELPAHMPTLDELYESCGIDFDLAIDVKAAPVATAILDAARRHGALDRLWLVTGPLTHAGLDRAGAHGVVTIRGSVLRSRARRATVLSLARDAGVEAINARWPWWTRELVAEVQALGMLTFGYDAQSYRALNRTVKVGLDGVFSDHVDRMLAVLRATS